MAHQTTDTRFFTTALFLMSFSALGFHSVADAKGTKCELSGGEVTFDAVGRPAMLKIHGTGSKPPRGILVLDGTKASGDFSFDLDSLDTSISLRDEHMKNKYLETKKYPTAKLKITKLTLSASFESKEFEEANLPFTGDLNLHGVTRTTPGKMSILSRQGKVKVESEFHVKIDDFKIPKPGYQSITMADDVTVRVNSQCELKAE